MATTQPKPVPQHHHHGVPCGNCTLKELYLERAAELAKGYDWTPPADSSAYWALCADTIELWDHALARGHTPAFCAGCGQWQLVAYRKPDGGLKWPHKGAACHMTAKCQGRMWAPPELYPTKKRKAKK